jgi:hypothetical protein
MSKNSRVLSRSSSRASSRSGSFTPRVGTPSASDRRAAASAAPTPAASAAASAAAGALSRQSSVSSRPAARPGFAFAGKPWHVKPGKTWARSASSRRLRRVDSNVFHDAEEVPHHERVVNSLNAGFWGGTPQNLRAGRAAAARGRWRRAINSATPTKARLLAVVQDAVRLLETTARAARYPSLTRMIQANLQASMLRAFEAHKAALAAAARKQTLYQGARYCVAGATGLKALAFPPAMLAAHLVLKGWDRACDRWDFLSRAGAAVNERIVRGVDKSMAGLWVGMGSTAAAAMPWVFDRVVKDKLTQWVSAKDPHLARLIDYDRITAALRRHQALVGAVLIGQDRPLLPVILDVAKALDACVLEALLARFLPHFRPAAHCAKR